MFEFKHPDYYKKLRKNLTNKDNYDKENHDEKIQSKNLRTRNRRKGLIPFPYEPTIEMIENAVAEYLNEGLMKIEASDFFAKDKYTITYEEITTEL